MKNYSKKVFAFILVVLMAFSTFAINVSAATSWPSLSSSAYCEFTAPSKINVYRNTSCTTRGTSSPAKSYNAYISANDICRILKITSSYIQLQYPTSSGYKTGYIKRNALFNVSAPTAKVTSKGKATTYTKAGGTSYGSIAKNDTVYNCGTSGNYTAVIYTAKSDNRAYKFGYIKTSVYNSTIINTASTTTSGSLKSPVPNGCYFSKKTNDNGWYGYHDINKNVSSSTPVYAISDGTVTYYQAYRTYDGVKYLTSYGNYIKFTSSDKVYTAKYCHLSKFNSVSLTIPSSRTKAVSGSTGTLTLATKTVKAGDIIGYVGTTGNSSGIHLHFELYKNSSRIDPTGVWSSLTA